MHRLRLLLLASASAVVTVAADGEAHAQSSELEEIIVTAQKREQNLQDVGIAVSAFGEAEVRALGVTAGHQIADSVAGVQVYNFMGSQPMFVIRGVGVQSFTPNLAPAAATYVDEVYYGSNILTGFTTFDIARVEILKGPQGTLFGRNTTAGAVAYATNRPSRTPEGYVEIGAANYESASLDFAVGGPLSERVRYRIAGRAAIEGDGWFRNRWTPAETPFPVGPRYFNPERSIGEWEAWAVRGLLEVDATENLSLLLNVHGSRKTGDMPALEPLGVTTIPGSGGVCDPQNYQRRFCGDALGYTDLDGKPYTVNVDFVGGNEEKNVGGSIRAEWDLGKTQVTSITAYDHATKVHFNDTDGAPHVELNQIRDVTVEQWSQELRLSSSGSEPLYWLVGGYVGDERIKQDFCGDLNRALGLTNFAFPSLAGRAAGACRLRWWQDTLSLAAYGHAEWRFAPTLTLVAGLRYTSEKKDFASISEWVYADGLQPDTVLVNFGSTLADAAFVDTSKSFRNLSGKLGLNWQAADNLLVYGSYSRGYKSGGFDGEFAFIRSQLDPYDEEILSAYELGWKSTLADGRLRLNGAAYYYDFRKPQLVSQQNDPVTGAPFNRLVNVRKAGIYGADLEADWRIAEGLEARFGLNLSRSEIEDSSKPQFDGGELPLTARRSASFLLRYERPLTDDVSMTLQVDGKYTSPYFLNPDNTPFLKQDDQTLVNARATLFNTRGWEASLWVKNLTKETYQVQSYALFGAYVVTYNPPRTYGAALRYAW